MQKEYIKPMMSQKTASRCGSVLCVSNVITPGRIVLEEVDVTEDEDREFTWE